MKHSFDCLYGRSSEKSIVAEYCLCAKDKIKNTSYICMQCGERRKTSQGVKIHLSVHMKNKDMCNFCDLDLSKLNTTEACVAHLNTHFPFAHGLVLPSKGKTNSINDILNDNKSGKEKEPYKNTDKEEYMKRSEDKYGTSKIGDSYTRLSHDEQFLSNTYEPPILGSFRDDELVQPYNAENSPLTGVSSEYQSEELFVDVITPNAVPPIDVLSDQSDAPIANPTSPEQLTSSSTTTQYMVPAYVSRSYKYEYVSGKIKQLERVTLYPSNSFGPFGSKECFDFATIFIRRNISVDAGKEIFEILVRQNPEAYPNSFEELLNCIDALPVIEPLIADHKIVVYEISDLIRFIFANKQLCRHMNFKDMYKDRKSCKIWTFQQTKDYHKMVKQARRLDPTAVPLPFQWCYDAFSNFSNFGISTGGSYLQALFYSTRYSHMAENLLIHGYCKSSQYIRIAHALVDNFDRLKNGIKIYNELNNEWCVCVPFLVFNLGDTPQRADFCCHSHHNAEEGCPFCNCKKCHWVMRSSLMRSDLKAKTMKDSVKKSIRFLRTNAGMIIV